MASHDEENFDLETQQRIRADLDRFMQSDSLRHARDIAAEDPLLLGSHVANFIEEASKRLRQAGNVEMAENCEFWLRLLRTFRELGVQEGYLEVVIGDLFRAKTPEDHRRILRDNPDLAGAAAGEFISRRIRESVAVADAAATGKYTLAATLIQVKSFDGPEAEDTRTTEAINTFMREFIHEQDSRAQRRLLEARPDLLESPLSLIVGSMFQPFIERARAANDLVALRALLLRQALFARCQKVGVAQAFRELADGVKWSELNPT